MKKIYKYSPIISVIPLVMTVSCGGNKVSVEKPKIDSTKIDIATMEQHKKDVQAAIDNAKIIVSFSGLKSEFDSLSDSEIQKRISIKQQSLISFEIKSVVKTATGIHLSALVKSSSESDNVNPRLVEQDVDKANIYFQTATADATNLKLQEVADAFTPTLKEGRVYTASKLVSSDFNPISKDTGDYEGMDIKAEVVGFPTISLANGDGSHAWVKVVVSSSIANTKVITMYKEVQSDLLLALDQYNKANQTESPSGLFNPMKIDDIKQDGVSWSAGIGWHSQAQGISLLINLGKKLGWTEASDATTYTGSLARYDALVATLLASPLQDAIIDPSGSDGTMSANWLEPFGWSTSTLGTWHGGFMGGYYDQSGSRIYAKHFGLFIDGSGTTPSGKLISRAWISPNGSNPVVKTLTSQPNTVRTYDKVSENEEDKLVSLICTSIANLRKLNPSMLSMAASVVNPDFISLVKYFMNSSNGVTNEKIKNAVKELNNGSHHLQAVEMFLRGIKGLSATEAPGGNKFDLVGLSSLKDFMSLTNWFHYTSDHHSYLKPTSSPVSPIDDSINIYN